MKTVSTKEYQKEAVSSLNELSEEKLKVALDFIEYLKDREEWEATWEVLGNKKMMEEIKIADDDWEKGQRKNFVSWEKVMLGYSKNG